LEEGGGRAVADPGGPARSRRGASAVASGDRTGQHRLGSAANDVRSAHGSCMTHPIPPHRAPWNARLINAHTFAGRLSAGAALSANAHVMTNLVGGSFCLNRVEFALLYSRGALSSLAVVVARMPFVCTATQAQSKQ